MQAATQLTGLQLGGKLGQVICADANNIKEVFFQELYRNSKLVPAIDSIAEMLQCTIILLTKYCCVKIQYFIVKSIGRQTAFSNIGKFVSKKNPT